MKWCKQWRERLAEQWKAFSLIQSCETEMATDPTDHIQLLLSLSPEAGSFIRVAVWLPADWNGRLLGLGNGGMAGSIPTDGLRYAILHGYIGVTTDMGTSRGMASGIGSAAVWRDFGHRATHWMTVLAKAAGKAVFDSLPDCAVFKGGSTGGEQALSEAQRYPEDYDAILCGAPANNRICLHTYFLWNFVHLKNRNWEPLFDENTVQAIHNCAIDYAQENGDGERGDHFISFPRGDRDFLTAFVRQTARKLSLDTAQESALTAIYTGPVHSADGRRIYNGLPLGAELYGCGLLDTAQMAQPPHVYPFYWGLGADFDPWRFRFAEDFDVLHRTLSPEMDANNADLSPFFARGGKLLMVSGTADPCVPWQDAWAYARRVESRTARAVLEDSFRFYVVPSADHSIAGVHPSRITAEDGRDVLDLLFDWRLGKAEPQSMRIYAAGYREKSFHERRIKPLVPSDGQATLFPPTTDESYLV